MATVPAFKLNDFGDFGNRAIATRNDQLGADYPAFVKPASIRIWLRANESTL
jgi:hypothetical protein